MIGILGGTFDPIHFGHLRPAVDVYESLSLDEVRLIPCSQPPHRGNPLAAATTRLAMIRAAIEGHDALKADDRELLREGPSYMVDTLASLKQDFPQQNLCLILGCDAFIELESWHRWRDIIQLANIAVTHRPGCTTKQIKAGSELEQWVETSSVENDRLRDFETGHVTFVEVTQLDISATRIREAIRQGKAVSYLLPEKVEQLINNQHIYG